ncbi:MAG: hypothetical protein DHS20C16_15200 [Phycisphaerae bacterium]|nr:MAG: hypothetical protein DHS20C16_15200 [Phycisphaerae bacterium]
MRCSIGDRDDSIHLESTPKQQRQTDGLQQTANDRPERDSTPAELAEGPTAQDEHHPSHFSI